MPVLYVSCLETQILKVRFSTRRKLEQRISTRGKLEQRALYAAISNSIVSCYRFWGYSWSLFFQQAKNTIIHSLRFVLGYSVYNRNSAILIDQCVHRVQPVAILELKSGGAIAGARKK